MTYANFNINGFGDVKLTPYSPLLRYKAWDSFIGSIQSLSDLIYNVDNNRNKMEITVNNAIQAADSFLSSNWK
ncbi:TPA: iron-regulated frpA domain protein, partial [Neisseria meningitidis]